MSEDRIGDRPLVIAPAVAEIANEIAARPWHRRSEPYCADAGLFCQAEAEMAEIMRARGFPVAADAALTKAGQRNFLVMGTPVVIAR